MQDTQYSPSIISTDELEAILSEPNVKILDCSVQIGRQDCSRMNFLRNHIKNAIYVDLDNLRDKKQDLPFMLPDEKLFSDLMKALNIKLSDQVICYETSERQFYGYRVAWMLETMNHPNVRVLDGGFAKWVAENKPCEATDKDAQDQDFQYNLLPMKIKNLRQIQEFNTNPNQRSFQLIDGRMPDAYDQGKINGSINIFSAKLLNQESKTLKSVQERREIYESAGIDLQKDIVLSCQAGIAASVQYGALKDICSGELSIYDGSWAEFKNYAI